MNSRQDKIVIYLAENFDRYTTTSYLAKLCSCSARTIRSDINLIENEVNKLGVKILRKPGVGIKFSNLNMDENLFKETIIGQKGKEIYDERSRKFHILLLLLMSKSPKSLDYLSEKFYCGKNIIRKDLYRLENLVNRYGLKLRVKAGTGIFIDGLERKKRELLSYLTKQIQENEDIETSLFDIFNPEDIEVVEEAIDNLKNSLSVSLDSNPINSIFLHMLFMINRIKSGESIEISSEEKESMVNVNAINDAKKIAVYLSNKLGIIFNEDEVIYLAFRIYCIDKSDYLTDSSQDLHNLVEKLIRGVSDFYDIDFNMDTRLYTNLLSHLSSSVKRLKTGFHIYNPLTNEIKREFTQIFLIIQMFLDEEATNTGLVFNEEETAYIAVHFQASREKLKNMNIKIRAVIAVKFGLGLGAFIEAKLKNLFPNLEIIDVILVSDIENYNNREDIDLLLTTEKNIKIEGADVIEISSLLEEADLKKIRKYIKSLGQGKNTSFDIMDFSNPFLVFLDRLEEDKDDLIRNMVSYLEEKDYVSKGLFLESVLKREQTSNTNIGEFIAIPHGQTDFVLKSCISFAIFKDQIWWSDSNVKIVVLLALKKESLKAPGIRSFFKILNSINASPEVIEKIVGEKNKMKILEFFSGKC